MDNKIKNTIKRLVAFSLFTIVSFITLNNIVFIHAHHLDTGEVMTHAHPFSNPDNELPENTHHHSTNDFIVIDHLLILFVVFFIAVQLLLFQTRVLKHPWFKNEIICCSINATFGRSPPSSLL
ncbi:hypothetical protein [Roseimarinus sediminis]|uniref:hypothetical protein n=1 Tax=Roseimarinus sediminis TaxID=1610899 RepID=UPI003D239464